MNSPIQSYQDNLGQPETPAIAQEDSGPSTTAIGFILLSIAIGGIIGWLFIEPYYHSYWPQSHPLVSNYNPADLVNDVERAGTSIKELSFSYPDQLTQLPLELTRSPQLVDSLEILNIEGAILPQLTPQIDQLSSLKSLTHLTIKDSGVKTLPSQIGGLTTIKYLNLGNNQISLLPGSIESLTNLESLLLYNNQINFLPDQIGQLTNLKILDLKNNQLASLPPSLRLLNNLENLYLGGNPLSDLEKENIKSYLPNTQISF
jgi:Leucine-rich repeat (LRR) protein